MKKGRNTDRHSSIIILPISHVSTHPPPTPTPPLHREYTLPHLPILCYKITLREREVCIQIFLLSPLKKENQNFDPAGPVLSNVPGGLAWPGPFRPVGQGSEAEVHADKRLRAWVTPPVKTYKQMSEDP